MKSLGAHQRELISRLRPLKLTPAGCPSILAGVHDKITIESDCLGLEGVG